MSGKGRTVLLAIVTLMAMSGLVVASVPLYTLFCKVTGFGGTVREADASSSGAHAIARTIVVRFDASVMRGMPWQFKPVQTSMTVHLGEPNLAFFTAENQSDQPINGTATFNVTPTKAGIYVNKIQCFCFTEQHLDPGQTAQLPVSFFIDPGIATDPNTDDVTTVTLSYTFFKARNQTSAVPAPSGAPKRKSEGPS